MKWIVTDFSSRVVRRLVRWIILAVVSTFSTFATSSHIARVEAAPNLYPEDSRRPAPMSVTVTLYSTLTGPGNYGYCRQGTEDMGDPYGNVDFGNAGVELGDLQARPVATWGQVNYGETRFVEWNHRPCGGRSDSAVISLASIPITATVQSATLSYHMLGASSNNPGTAYGVVVAPFGSIPSVTTGSLDCNCWWSRALPLSTAQTWITNRTSSGLSITYGDYWSGWYYTSDQQTLTLTYTTDTTPPTTTHGLSGIAGNAGWYRSNVDVTLTATDNVGGVGVALTTMDGSSYTTARTISTQGASTHTYFSTDAANNIETTKSFTLNIDTVAPSSALTSHTSNQPVRGTISLTGTASDVTSGLAQVEVSTNSGASWNTATLTGGNWSYPINTTSFSDGSTTFQIRSTDNAGNQSTLSHALLADNTPPTASHSIAGTTGNNGYYVTAPVVTISATDATSGVASRTFDGANYTTSVTISTQGTTSHTYFSTDAAGNNSTTGSFTIKVDTVAPSAAITSHTANQPVRSTISFHGSVSDATSGIFSVEVSTNGGTSWNVATLAGGSWSYAVDTAAFSDGSKTFQVRSTDNAGNVQSAISHTLLIDNTPPTITHALSGTIGSNGWYTSTVTLTLTATDATSGIVSRTFNGANYTAPITLSTEGTTTYIYSTTDAAGNVSATQTVTVKIDTVKPVTVFSSPTNNVWVDGVVTLSGASADSSSGVAQAQISVDGGAWQNATGSSSWTYVLNTTTLSDGAHTIRARATDNAGNLESTATLVINVDNTTPKAAITADCPFNGNDGWCRAPVEIRVGGSTGGSGLQSLVYSYNGNVTTITSGSALFGVPTTGSVEVFTTNKLGRRSPTQSASFKVDGAGPTIEFRNATRGQINFKVSDSGSGVKRWTLQIFNARGESVFWQSAGIAFDGLLDWSGNTLVGGDYSVEIFASDVAGNESGNREGRFTLAAPTPTPTKIPVIQPLVNLFFPSATQRPTATPLPTATPIPVFTPRPTLVTVTPSTAQLSVPLSWRSFSGIVFWDRNGNSVQELDEPGLASVPIEVIASITGDHIMTYSGADGSYIATLPRSSGYVVKLHLPTGWFLLSDARIVSENGRDVVADFGMAYRSIALLLVVMMLLTLGILMTVSSVGLIHRATAIREVTTHISEISADRTSHPRLREQ